MKTVDRTIYLQNSVVCLQKNWWNPFFFISDAIETIQNLMNPEGASNYECNDPFIKMKYQKTDLFEVP
jgi:hypothetical protein